MALFYVQNITHPISSTSPHGVAVDALAGNVDAAIGAFLALPAAAAVHLPGDQFSVIAGANVLYRQSNATYTFGTTTGPTPPPFGT